MSVNSHTVTDAFNKICPFIEEGDYNRHWPAYCRATDCMAWQWETDEVEYTRGFCGLTRKGDND